MAMNHRIPLLVVLMWAGAITCAQDKVEVKGGALIERMGSVKLIDEMVIVKKNISEIIHSQKKAMEMEGVIDSILEKEKDENSLQLLKGLKETLSGLIRSRKKRSLMPFVGNILNGLFGTATESDIEKEEERLAKIENWANEYGHVVSNLVDETNDHAIALTNITDTLNSIADRIESKLNNEERKLIILNLALKLETVIVNVKDTFNGLLMAHQGMATVNLITPKQVQDIIEYSIVNFAFKPLNIDLYSYYHLMTVKVVHNICFIFLPFDNDQELLLNKIVPFPMIVEDIPIILRGNQKLLIENKRNDLVSLWPMEELNNCVLLTKENFICHFDNFYLQPLNKYPCFKFLLNHGEDSCLYDEFNQDFAFHFLKSHLYVFTNISITAIVDCKHSAEQRVSIHNVHVFPRDCKIKIVDHFYYNPHVFQQVNLNETKVNTHFKVTTSHFQLPRVSTQVKLLPRMSNNILFVYRTKVMPYVTLVLLPLIILIVIIAYVIIKKLLLKRVNRIRDILHAMGEN